MAGLNKKAEWASGGKGKKKGEVRLLVKPPEPYRKSHRGCRTALSILGESETRKKEKEKIILYSY